MPQAIFHRGIKIKNVVLIRQRGFLHVGKVPAIGVLFDKRFPCRAPLRRLAEGAHARSAYRPPVGIHPHIAAADKIQRAVIKVVVCPVVHPHALCGHAVPIVDIFGEQRSERGRGVMRHVVPPHLPVVIHQPFGERFRLRQQQQTHILIGVTRHQHHLGRLKIFHAVFEISHARDARGLFIDLDFQHMRTRNHGETLGLQRLGYGGHRCGILRVHMTAAAIAVAVIHARRAFVVGYRVDRSRTGERRPAQFLRHVAHVIRKLRTTQWRHRVFTRARRFKNIAARIDLALDIAGLAGDADFVFDLVVIRLQLFVAKRPILHRAALGDARRAVAFGGITHHLEIPRIQPPALRPVMQRGAAYRIHHRMQWKARCIRRLGIGPMRGYLGVGLLHRLRPAAKIIAQLVRRKIARGQPVARFETYDIQPRACERQHRRATDGAQTHDHDIRALEISGHDCRRAC